VEDLAGIAIVLTILFSAVLAGHESVNRLFHPQVVQFLWVVAAASLIGFSGSESCGLSLLVGKEIGSAALIADGHHAPIDGLTSLAVFFGAVGLYLGFPLADPLVGLAITLAILRIVWGSGKEVFTRPSTASIPPFPTRFGMPPCTPKARRTSEVRVRWIGHRLYAEANVAVNPD
jgi:cation diffusion facilitator family transporter